MWIAMGRGICTTSVGAKTEYFRASLLTSTPFVDNPTDVVAGNQHWGHATSRDLYHWTNQPIALFPPNSTSGIFTGSAVIDSNNTSGFFPNTTDGVVAIYTLNTATKQVQELAYSYDGGYSFTPYSGNPVIDVGSNQFRDPKVIWYEDHWVMAVSYATEFTVGIYTSPNLKDWTHASNFTHAGLLGLQYECPNLVEVPFKNSSGTGWVLGIGINPGAPLGGSIDQYIPGQFNGTHFTAFDSAARIADFGKDNYAGQWFFGVPQGEAVSVAWASNWEYTNDVPTASEGWRSVMTLPRRNFLTNASRVGWDLVSEPYDLTPILGTKLGGNDSLINSTITIDYSNVSSNAVYFDVNITIPEALTANLTGSATFNFTFSASGGEKVSGGYFLGGSNAGTVWLDRGKTNGFDNTFFTDKFSLTQASNAKRIQGVFDRSIFEVFLDEGDFSGTTVFYPTQPLTQMTAGTTGLLEGVQLSVGVWALEAGWP
jgi:beta-fructofuranosidase